MVSEIITTDATFDARLLRDAFGCFATGVTIVTGRGVDGTSVGLTANSFTSLSLDPPLLLFCPAKSASALPTLRETGRFAVNVLHSDAESVSNRFSQRNIDRFADAHWEDWEGLPVLADSMASFGCTLHAEHDGGDHVIIVGRINRLRFTCERDPLLYLQGRYRRVHVAT
jgi:flavin reductase (DIM6/NTAB) family NADH-FMN oxidoreductase RutF